MRKGRILQLRREEWEKGEGMPSRVKTIFKGAGTARQ